MGRWTGGTRLIFALYRIQADNKPPFLFHHICHRFHEFHPPPHPSPPSPLPFPSLPCVQQVTLGNCVAPRLVKLRLRDKDCASSKKCNVAEKELLLLLLRALKQTKVPSRSDGEITWRMCNTRDLRRQRKRPPGGSVIPEARDEEKQKIMPW